MVVLQKAGLFVLFSKILSVSFYEATPRSGLSPGSDLVRYQAPSAESCPCTVKKDADFGCCGSSTSKSIIRAYVTASPLIILPSFKLGIGFFGVRSPVIETILYTLFPYSKIKYLGPLNNKYNIDRIFALRKRYILILLPLFF